jgi:hypothetical protein
VDAWEKARDEDKLRDEGRARESVGGRRRVLRAGRGSEVVYASLKGVRFEESDDVDEAKESGGRRGEGWKQ